MGTVKTQAIVFEEVGKAVLKEVELPEPTPDDIVVENEVSGVSVGTERWAYIGKRPEISFPMVPGYTGIGRIVEVGEAAAECGYCVGQRVNFASSRILPAYNKGWMGSHLAQAVVNVTETAQGGWADIHRCEFVPENCSPLGASLAVLCGVALRGIEMAVVPAGAKVMVCGLGVIGQYAVQVVRLKGAQVCAVEVDETRLETARSLGADWAINPATVNLADEAAQIAPEGFDIIIDTSSKDEVVNRLLPLLKIHGKMVFQGWYPPPSSLDLNVMHSRMSTCYFPCAHSGSAVATAMRWVAAGVLDTESLITHIARPEQAPQIYQMMAENKEDFLGIVFDWRQTV